MKEFFDLLYQNRVTPNGLLTLQMSYRKDEYPNFINSSTEERRLVMGGFMFDRAEGTKRVTCITDKGRHLLAEAEKCMLATKKTKKINAIPFEEWESLIKEYLAKFPTGTQGASPIRSPAKSLHDRFKWFFLTYPEFTWEDVLAATEAYLNSLEHSKDGFKYISTSQYFIKKQENDKTNLSRLANWCQAVKDGTIHELSSEGVTHFGSDVV